MTIQQQFKNLNGSTVSRSQLEAIIANAKKANDTEIIYRLSGILLANKGVNKFDVSLRNYPTALAGSRHKGAYKEALTECGRLRKGWRFSKGGVFKVATLDKKTKQFKMGLSGCGCGAPKNTCGCKKKSLNANNLSFEELEGLGLPFVPNPESVEDPTALGKPFTNDDIYQMITDKMISLVEKSTGTGYKRKWGQKEFYEKDGFLIPINFVSKNAYRGVNPWLLKDDFLDVMDNPYFMTFKQIKEKKGKLKKGSKGKPIVYFTLLYKFDNPKTKKEFGTYDKEYMIKYIKNFGYSKSDFDDVVNSIPILKYYNVFNGSDIEEIDFKLDELKLGRVIKSDESLANERNEIAELIVANYPKMAPTIKHGGDEAYYNSATDGVQMPRFQSFETPNDYYRTLLHELIHSTGNEKRLARKFGKKFGSKDYAFEELVAEFGSVFLSANAGIIWHSNKNHEEYLANWNNSLKIAKDDNKFLMRAASAAQKASDFALNLNASKVPAFYKELGKITDTKKTVKKTATKKTTSIPDGSAYPVAIPETKITIKANAPFNSCGRLRKGWHYKKGKLTQVASKVKAVKKPAVKRLTYLELIKKAKFKVGDKVYYLNNANQKQFRTIKYISRYDTVNKQAVHYGFTGVDAKTREGFPEAKLFLDDVPEIIKKAREGVYNYKFKLVHSMDTVHEMAMVGYDTTSYADYIVAKSYAYHKLAVFIYKNIANFPYYKNNNLLYEAQKPELTKLFKKEIKKRKLTVNIDIDIPLNYKPLKNTKTVKRPSKEVVLKDRINQEGNYIKQITAFLKETRAKSKKTAKDKKNINYWVIAIKEAKKRKSLNEKLLKELGEILTPKKNDVTIYAYNKITAKEMAVYSDDELYLLYRAIAKQQNKTGIDKELIRYNRGVIIKALRHPLKHYSYLDKTYNFVLDELIEEKKLHDHAILGHDAHMYSDKVIAKGYAYANLARFIYFYRLSFPFYKRTKLLKEAQNPELRKLFEKEIKKRKLKVNVQAVVPITPEQKAIKRKRDKAKTVVKPTPIKLGNPKNTKNPENPKKTNTLAYKMANRQNQVSEIYKIKDKNISEFLGQIEVKEKESVVITLTGGQGSMKTRCAFRFINAFAQKYKVGHASIEEHPESTLYYNKVDEYINDNALNNIHNPEINSISDLDRLVKENDIIVIDSFAKMQEIQKGFEVDKDLRKKYDGKLFIVIFQQTTDGKMRGGSKSQFDADIILFTEKFDNYQDNYIYADKNRYQNKNLTDLKYNIFEGVLKDVE
ncbi:ArdC family protein [Tenacibaculum finnmarkense]|uniref:ArdC family protein n=1 Tax=Tenacibaculum finnmarkense TaxID=2781243 RepID=UPI003BB50B29